MKKTVGVIFGGQSTEHDISIITAISSVIRPLLADGHYEVLPIYITKDGGWYADAKLADVSLYRTGMIAQFLQSSKRVWLDMGQGFALVTPGLRPTRQVVDIVFPAMHGMNGEDGALMGLLQMAGVPFVGCDMAASSLAMDKMLSKTVAAAAGVPVATSVYVTSAEYADAPETVLGRARELKLPLFVKPTHLGSSIGITRVTKYEDIANALEIALHYDTAALIEEAVQNLIEVTVPVIGNDSPRTALVEKPLTKSEDFFDFETKYINQGGKKSGGGKKGAQGYSELPAQLPDGLYHASAETALAVYKALGCSGTSRVDLLIDSETRVVYFNEINPLPGSLYAHNWRKAGVSSVELVNELIDLALERHEQKSALTHTFTTSFLKQF